MSKQLSNKWSGNTAGNKGIYHHLDKMVVNYMIVIQTLFTNLTPPCHMLNGLFTNCDIWLVSSYFGVNRDGCHMWVRKCSLFLEHLISLPCIIIYTLYITEFVCGLMVCLPGFVRLVCLPGFVRLVCLGLIWSSWSASPINMWWLISRILI